MVSPTSPENNDLAGRLAVNLLSFALGAVVAVPICYVALKIYDRYGGSESALVLGIAIVIAGALVWQGHGGLRAFGVGLLILLVPFLILGWAVDGMVLAPEPPPLHSQVPATGR